MNKDYENLKEITDLCKEELENNNQDTTAILDIEDLKSLNNILTDYQRVLKENEEYSKQLDLDYVHNNYIPKQEIKDKIEIELKKAEKDLQEAIRLEKEAQTKESSILWWAAQIRADERIKVLKEILKEVKKDGNGDNV